MILVRFRWWFGTARGESLQRKASISKMLDISPVRTDEITRSSEYLNEIRYLMRTTRNSDENTKWIRTYPNCDVTFANRMQITKETANILFQELMGELGLLLDF